MKLTSMELTAGDSMVMGVKEVVLCRQGEGTATQSMTLPCMTSARPWYSQPAGYASHAMTRKAYLSGVSSTKADLPALDVFTEMTHAGIPLK